MKFENTAMRSSLSSNGVDVSSDAIMGVRKCCRARFIKDVLLIINKDHAQNKSDPVLQRRHALCHKTRQLFCASSLIWYHR